MEDIKTLFDIADRNNESSITINSDSIVFYKKNTDVKHRDGDEPAVIYRDGTQEWWRHGTLFRHNDKPTIVTKSGIKIWFISGYLFRAKAPSIVFPDGTEVWYDFGRIHRCDDKPAVTMYDGTQKWAMNGCLHREDDKPAVITPYGRQEWWKHGELSRKNGPVIIKEDGTEEYALPPPVDSKYQVTFGRRIKRKDGYIENFDANNIYTIGTEECFKYLTSEYNTCA